MLPKIDNKYHLAAISPIDGRYFLDTLPLSTYFSEFALIKTRHELEMRYLLFLSSNKVIRKLNKSEVKKMNLMIQNFGMTDAVKVKKLEEVTKHDVKAIEYLISAKFKKTPLADLIPFIHFGITSYDINDNAYRLMVLRSLEEIIIPEAEILIASMEKFSNKHLSLPMLARTHGQAAVPTTLGKEMKVFSSRLKVQLRGLKETKLFGKFGGAVGNWNSLRLTFPEINWVKLSSLFLSSLGLEHSKITAQIAPPEDLIGVFQNLSRFNGILLDFSGDVWRYISDGWLVQKGKTDHVGSSTMPQKVNPIEFENAEGNLTIANGLFETLSRKLPVSRLQRDLSDSTILRNIGVAFAHSLISYKGCIKGLNYLAPDQSKILRDLNYDWSILSEALQTLMRKENNISAYERVAKKVRGKKLNQDDWIKLINSTNLSEKNKKILINLTPQNYLGYAGKN